MNSAEMIVVINDFLCVILDIIKKRMNNSPSLKKCLLNFTLP